MHFFISFLVGVVLFYSFQYFPFSTVFTFLLSSVYLSIKKRFFLILIILSGIAFAFIRYEPLKDMSHIGGKEVAVKGVFSAPADLRESHAIKTDSGMFKQPIDVKSAVDIKTGGRLDELAGREIILFSEREFEPRREYELTIKFPRGRMRFNPGTWRTDVLSANLIEVVGSGNLQTSLASKFLEQREGLNRYFSENFSKDSAAFVASITTGQRAFMDESLRNAFNATGLTHILSISGTHFGLFSVLLFGMFRLLIGVLPYKILQKITIYLTPSQTSAILCFPFMLAYLGLSGGSIPAVRSFIMISLFLVGLLIARKGFWLNTLLFAAFVLSVWKPGVILDLSFQLSFLAVFFIGFVINTIEEEKRQEKGLVAEAKSPLYLKKVSNYFKNALLLTLSASIGTAPLVAYHFHYFSIISPLSNLFVAPLIGFVLIPLSVAGSFLYLITGHYVFTPLVSAVSDVSISLVRLLSQVPFADIKVPAFPLIIVMFFYAGFIFYFLSGRPKDTDRNEKPNSFNEMPKQVRHSWGRRRYTLLIPFVPIIIYFSLSIFERKELTVTYLDVGQGDSSVVELPDGKTIVIDTGRSGRETASFLKYRGKETVDALVLSHLSSDHTGGLDFIVRNFKVKEIWDNGRIVLPDTFNNIKRYSLNRGDLIEGRGYSIYILHPYPEFYTMYGSEHTAANNSSLLLRLEGDKKSFFFTGDVEEEAQEDILHLGKWLKSDVIKVPHHGGKTSAYEPFFRTVSPDIAVISVGRDNAFGHPHQEMLNVLQGMHIFRTDIDGAVKISEKVNGLEIKTYGDFQLQRAKSLSDEIKNIKRIFETW